MSARRLKAIFLLRWQLNRNAFRRTSAFSAAVYIILRVLFLLGLVGGTIGAFFLGKSDALAANPNRILWLVSGAISAFLFFWLIGLLAELQRSDSLDHRRMAHLPISLKEMFLFNYAVSHWTPSCLLFLWISAGFVIGTMFRFGGRMALISGLLALMILAISSWTYALRGWLTKLMLNERRRRSLIVWMTCAVILMVQVPNLLFNNSLFGFRAVAETERIERRLTRDIEYAESRFKDIKETAKRAESNLIEEDLQLTSPQSEAWRQQNLRRHQERLRKARERLRETFEAYRTSLQENAPGDWRLQPETALSIFQSAFPPLWPASAAASIARNEQGQYKRAFWIALELAGLCYLALIRAFRAIQSEFQMPSPRSQQRFKREETTPKNSGKTKPMKNWLERNLPGISNPTAAVAWGTLRCLTRMPEAKMTLLIPILLLVVFGALYFDDLAASKPDAFVRFLPSSILFLSFMGSLPFFTNAFGFDRSGFCAIVLSPVPRSQILLGKNLAILPPFLLLAALPLFGIQLLARPPILYTISAFLQALTLCLLLTLFGNLLSIKAPYRSKPGSLQPVKTKSGVSALMNMLFPFLFILLLIPTTMPLLVEELSQWMPFFPFHWNITLSALSLLVIAFSYRQSLHSMGNLLASREQEILRVVTEQVD